MNPVILSADIGTSSLKAALIDVTGKVIASARVRFSSGKRQTSDWVSAFHEALVYLSPPAQLAGITISGNGPTLVSVAGNGDTRVLLWNDTVPAEPIGPSLFIPRIKAFATLFPADFAGARYLLSGPEYLVWYLTGNALTVLPEERYKPVYWESESLTEAGIDGSILAPFVLPGARAGTLRPERAAALGIPAGVPVFAAGPDFIAALVGTGTISAGKACDRAGTSEGLNVCTATRLEKAGLRTLPAVVTGHWNLSFMLSDSGARFNSYRRESGQSERNYPDIMKDIVQSPILPPPGESLHEGRRVAEETAFALRRGIAAIEILTQQKHQFVLSGGQARNEIWNQMKADCTGSVFQITATPDGELMGNAMLAAVSLGHYTDLSEAAATMVRITRTWEPDQKRAALYTEKFLKT